MAGRTQQLGGGMNAATKHDVARSLIETMRKMSHGQPCHKCGGPATMMDRARYYCAGCWAKLTGRNQ